MSSRKPVVVKHGLKSTAAHKRVQQMLKSEMVLYEYQEALKFAIWFNSRRCRSNGVILTDNALKTVEKASKEYVLSAQAQHMSPKDIKRKILASSRKSRNKTIWTANEASEDQYSLMIGSKRRVKA
ncbi:hypothetical protein I4P15_10345 [Enterobacter roggenkampii]|nr:hypothetical protein [Enterobacter roggenkampii]